MNLIPSRTLPLGIKYSAKWCTIEKSAVRCEDLPFSILRDSIANIGEHGFCVLFSRSQFDHFILPAMLCVCVQMEQITPSWKAARKECEGKISEWKCPPRHPSQAFFGAIVLNRAKIAKALILRCCSATLTNNSCLLFAWCEIFWHLRCVCAVYTQQLLSCLSEIKR